jgi:hypothetical protein
MWNNLVELCSQVRLTDKPDKVRWLLTRSGDFSVKSLYLYLSARRVNFPYKVLWKLRISLRIKVFCWLVIKNRVLTRNNLKNKGWKGNDLCEFCDNLESQNHLFFGCPLARYVWNVVGVALNINAMPSSCLELYRQCFASFSRIDRKVVMIGAVALCWTLWRTRNNSFFDGMRSKDPTNVIFLICHFLNSWAKLRSYREARSESCCSWGLADWRRWRIRFSDGDTAGIL